MLGLFWVKRSDQGSDRDRIRRAGRRGQAVRRGHRPALEGLEERIVLATDTWTGSVSSSWMTAGNWSPAVTPSPGDTLVFPASSSNPNPTNDFPSGTSFASITIQGAGYNLTGNPLALTSGISASYSTGTSTDAIPTTLSTIVAPISVSAGGTLDISGALSGAAGVNVAGGGILDLSGLNTYSGPTTIGSGTILVVDGTVAGVQNNGGLLAGNGSVGGVSSVGGTLLPGHPGTSTTPQPTPGQLTAGASVAFDSGSTFASLLNGTSPGNGVTGYGQLIVSAGSISLGGAKLDVGLGTSYTPTVGDQLIIIQNNTGTAINGTFSSLPEGAEVTAGSSLFRISYLGTNGSGDSVVLSAVAAPSTTTLLPVQIPSNSGQPFTISAQVTGTQGTPTGTVEFFNGNPSSGGVVLATAPVTALSSTTGLASATVSSLGSSSSSPALYALYIPTPTTFTYAGSTSAPITFATTTTLVSSSPVGLIGQPITFTATVVPATANAGTPTGSVEFIADSKTVLGTVPINPATGQASITTSSLGIGTHTIVAQFMANSPFQNSTSSSLSQSISTAGVTPVLTIEPILGRHGKVYNYALVATIEPTVEVGVIPSGSVTYFINGRASYQTVGLTNGTAVIIRPGGHLANKYVYVRYNGSSTFVAGASEQTYISYRKLALLARDVEKTIPSLTRGRRTNLSRSQKAW